MEVWRDKRLHTDLITQLKLNWNSSVQKLSLGFRERRAARGLEGGEAVVSELLACPDQGRGTTCWRWTGEVALACACRSASLSGKDSVPRAHRGGFFSPDIGQAFLLPFLL